MKIDQAISLLKQYIDYNNPDVPDFYTMAEACKVAIKALEQEPCDDCISRQAVEDAIYDYSRSCDVNYAQIMEFIDKLPSVTPQPCDDAISRQAVLDALDKSKYSNEFCEEHHIDWSINLGMAHIVVNELKPVTPQQKMGRWSHDGSHWENRFICSECRYKLFDEQTNYCPNCGAKMQEVEE